MTSGGEDLPPSVADLIEKVEARVADAPTVTEIRDLAARAVADGAPYLTVAEIGQLADVAIGRARLVQDYAAQLARLTRGVA